MYKNLPLFLIFYTILSNSFVLPAHLQLSLFNALPIPFGLKFQSDFYSFFNFQAPVLWNAHLRSRSLLKHILSLSSRFHKHLFLHSLHSFLPQPIWESRLTTWTKACLRAGRPGSSPETTNFLVNICGQATINALVSLISKQCKLVQKAN